MKYIIKNDNGEVIAECESYSQAIEHDGDLYCKCDKCGTYELYDDIVIYDGEDYCENCRDEYLTYCDHCGSYTYNDDACSVNGRRGEEVWCSSCRDDDAFYCYGCREYYANSSFDYTYHNDLCYCEGCRDELLYWCEECENYFYEDEGSYDDERGCWLCDECQEEMGNRSNRIMGYHQRPQMRYYTSDVEYTTTNNNFKGFGIELEIDRRERDNEQESVDLLNELLGDNVYYNRDGSLSYGYEIITQPHTRTALTSLNWEDALKGLVRLGYRSHDIKSCGLHMHASRTVFGDTEVERTENIAKVIWFYNEYWNDILKFSRRTQEQADRWASKYCNIHTLDDCKNIASSRSCGRYYAINMQNQNTVEFRLMRGTLNHKTFMATLDFLMTIAENSKRVTNTSDLTQWFDGIADTTKEYMATRNCFGYSNNQETTEQGDEE